MKKLIYFLIPLIIFSCKRVERKIENEKSELRKSELEIENANVSRKLKNLLKCNFETYLEYKDSVPIFINPNGKIAKYFRFEDDPEYDFGGSFLFKNAELGWLQIGKDEFNPDLEGYWIKSDFIKIGTTNYNNQIISLYEKPSKDSKVTGYLNEESYLNVLNCDSKWVYVIKGDNSGWLSPEFICNNSVTNCN